MISATTVSFDADRMRRYDREGPRYTSYPTAQQFSDGTGANAYDLAAAASRGARQGTPLSAYVHIRFAPAPAFIAAVTKLSPKSCTASMLTSDIFCLKSRCAAACSIAIESLINCILVAELPPICRKNS